MSIAPEEFLPYINGALDGMVQIVETMGDERINQRPSNMSNTSSPFVILTHCVGLTHYWLGAVIAGRQVHRDRDAEFRARGRSPRFARRCARYNSKSRKTSNTCMAISPLLSLRLYASPTCGPGHRDASPVVFQRTRATPWAYGAYP